MNNDDKKLLEANGWFVECESPFEIRHDQTESFASGYAARLILDSLISEQSRDDKIVESMAQAFVDDFKINATPKDYNIDETFGFGCLGEKSPRKLMNKFYYIFKNKSIM